MTMDTNSSEKKSTSRLQNLLMFKCDIPLDKILKMAKLDSFNHDKLDERQILVETESWTLEWNPYYASMLTIQKDTNGEKDASEILDDLIAKEYKIVKEVKVVKPIDCLFFLVKCRKGALQSFSKWLKKLYKVKNSKGKSIPYITREGKPVIYMLNSGIPEQVEVELKRLGFDKKDGKTFYHGRNAMYDDDDAFDIDEQEVEEKATKKSKKNKAEKTEKKSKKNKAEKPAKAEKTEKKSKKSKAEACECEEKPAKSEKKAKKSKAEACECECCDKPKRGRKPKAEASDEKPAKAEKTEKVAKVSPQEQAEVVAKTILKSCKEDLANGSVMTVAASTLAKTLGMEEVKKSFVKKIQEAFGDKINSNIDSVENDVVLTFWKKSKKVTAAAIKG